MNCIDTQNITSALPHNGSYIKDLKDSLPTHLQTYSLSEISCHDSYHDCWVVIYDKVYDLGHFLQEHPGGDDVILEYAGHDATLAFRSVGHSSDALIWMEKYCVGILVENERIYLRNKNSSFG